MALTLEQRNRFNNLTLDEKLLAIMDKIDNSFSYLSSQIVGFKRGIEMDFTKIKRELDKIKNLIK